MLLVLRLVEDMTSQVWESWDGMRLDWRLDPAVVETTQIELRLDGVVFERRPMTESGRCEFPLAPAGHTDMLFSLHAPDGRPLAPTWRVRHGQPATPGRDAWQGDPRPLIPFAVPLPAPQRLASAPNVYIVVPVHNSAKLVRDCVESIRRWTPATARLILIDDASEESAIEALLQEYENTTNIQVLRNAQNLGYTRSCNRGIEAAGGDDVVLLNADTEVGPRWLQRLRQIAYSHESIGSVTAVSDNAGAFSVPDLESFCPIPARWSLDQTQRAVLQQAGGCLPELPSGNGFCMYLKREVLDRVGLLDADAFPEGYGEENDWCQRAERVGFRHVIAGDVLIRHVRSASFGEARRLALGLKGMEILRSRYPDYEEKVGATLYSFARRVLDYRVRRVYADRDGIYTRRPPRPRVLIVVDDEAHGVALSKAVQDDYQALILAVNDSEIRLSYGTDNPAGLPDERVDLNTAWRQLRQWLVRDAIELVHVMVALPMLDEVATELDIAVLDSVSAASERVIPDATVHADSASDPGARDRLSRLYRQCLDRSADCG